MLWLSLLLWCSATLALPLPEEMDSEESRKVLGSSVVTSVSVITDLGNGSQAIFTDATGQQVTKPVAGGDVGSPVAMATPDHYSYYTFDSSGNLITRYMTKDDVSSIIATNQKYNAGKRPSTPTFYHNMPSNIGDQGFETSQEGEEHENLGQAQLRVHSVVESVQNLLKSQMSSQPHPEIPGHSTPDTSASWTMILPSFFGNQAINNDEEQDSTEADDSQHNVTENVDVAASTDKPQQPTADTMPKIPVMENQETLSETPASPSESTTHINNPTDPVVSADEFSYQPIESQVVGDAQNATSFGEVSTSTEKYVTAFEESSSQDSKPVPVTEPQQSSELYDDNKAEHLPTVIPISEDLLTSEIVKETTVSTLVNRTEPEPTTEPHISESFPASIPEYSQVPLIQAPSESGELSNTSPESTSAENFEVPITTMTPANTFSSSETSEVVVPQQPDVSSYHAVTSTATHSEQPPTTQTPEASTVHETSVADVKPAETSDKVNSPESIPVTEYSMPETTPENHKTSSLFDDSVMMGDAPGESSSQGSTETSEEKDSAESTETPVKTEVSTENSNSEENHESQLEVGENSQDDAQSSYFDHMNDDHFAEDDDDEEENLYTEAESTDNFSSTEVHTSGASGENTEKSEESTDKSEENKTPVSSEELGDSKEQTITETTLVISDDQLILNATQNLDDESTSEKEDSLTSEKQEDSESQSVSEATTSEEQAPVNIPESVAHSAEETVSGSEEKHVSQAEDSNQSDDPKKEDVKQSESASTENYESTETVSQAVESASLSTEQIQTSTSTEQGTTDGEQTAYHSDTIHETEQMQHDGAVSDQNKDEAQIENEKVSNVKVKPHADLVNTLVLSDENHSSFNQIDTSSSKETNVKNENSSFAGEKENSTKVDAPATDESEPSKSDEIQPPNTFTESVEQSASVSNNDNHDTSSESFVSSSPIKTTDTSSSTPEVTVESETTEVQEATNVQETVVASNDTNHGSHHETSTSESIEDASASVVDNESSTKQETSESSTSDETKLEAIKVNNENKDSDSNASQNEDSKSSTEQSSSHETSTEQMQEGAATDIVITSVSSSTSSHSSSSKVTPVVEKFESEEGSGSSKVCGIDSTCSEEKDSVNSDMAADSPGGLEVTSNLDNQESNVKSSQSSNESGDASEPANVLTTENPLDHSGSQSTSDETYTTTSIKQSSSVVSSVTPTSTTQGNADDIPISNEEVDNTKKKNAVSLVETTEKVPKKNCDREGSGDDGEPNDCDEVSSGDGSGNGSGDGSTSDADRTEETTEGSGDAETSSEQTGGFATRPIPIGVKSNYKASDVDTNPSVEEEMQDIMKYADSMKDIGITKAPTLKDSDELISEPLNDEDNSETHNTDKRNDEEFITTTASDENEFDSRNESSSDAGPMMSIFEYANSNTDIGITKPYNSSETESTEPNFESTTLFDEDMMMNDDHYHDPTDDVDDDGDEATMLGNEQFLKDFVDVKDSSSIHKEQKPTPVKNQKVDIVKNVEVNTKFSTSENIPVKHEKKPLVPFIKPGSVLPSDEASWSKLDLVSPLENVPLLQKPTTLKPASEKLHDDESLNPENQSDESQHPPQVENKPQFYSPSSVELHPAPLESLGLEASTAHLVQDVQQFAELCNELAFKLWVSMTEKGGTAARSLVLSPFAVTSLLAMIFLGAKGSTSGQMNDMLKLDDMMTFNPHQVFKNVTESVVETRNQGVRTAAFVRELYSDKNKGPLLDFYKQRASQFYDGLVEEANFTTIGDVLRRRTNLLIKKQTGGRVPEYLRGSSLQLQPPLAAFSANIFQTECRGASTDGRDGEMYFTILPATRQRRLVPIPAAVFHSGFLAGYEPSLDATVVSLGMQDSAISTIFVLPGQQGQTAPGDGLTRLEARLIGAAYSNRAWSRLLRSLLQRPGLEIQIPRFSHRSLLNVTHSLQTMGLNDLFNPVAADLKGLSGVKSALHVSDIVQVNTFTTCGEEVIGSRHHVEIYPTSPQRFSRETGRVDDLNDVPLVSRPRQARIDLSLEPSGFEEAVSQEGIIKMPLALRPRQARLPDGEDSLPRLKFDRPFLYFVRHNPTGFILHMGRFNPRLLH